MAGRKQNDPAYGEPVSDQEYNKLTRMIESVLQKCSSSAASPPLDKTLQAMILLQRSSCYERLNDQDSVVSDSKRVLKLLADFKDVQTTVCYVKRCLIVALYKKQKLSQAEDMVREWLNQCFALSEDRKQPIAILERFLVIFQLSSSGAGGGKRPQQTILDTEMQQLDQKLNNWIRDSMPGDQLTENALHPFRLTLDTSAKVQQLREDRALKELLESTTTAPKAASAAGGEDKKQTTEEERTRGKGKQRKNKDPETFKCTYCAITYDTRSELTVHCQSESHQIVIMSDEGRDWTCRPPPRGYSADTYSLCESFMETNVCHFGGQCIEAHGVDELSEWKQRFEYRRMRLEKAREIELYGKSYTETLLEKWVSAAAPDQVMRERVHDVEDIDCPALSSVVSSKVSTQEWEFSLRSPRELRAVALLQDAYRSHFKLVEIKTGAGDAPTLPNDQEWVKAEPAATDEESQTTYSIKVAFTTSIYGTFRQSVVFDFGTEPVMVKHICVDVLPVSDLDKMAEIKKDLVTYTARRWDETNAEIIPFQSGFVMPQTAEQKADVEYERLLMERYPCPSAETLQLSQSTINEKRLTKNNYRNRMHELLYLEEIARYEHVARFNLTTKLKVTANYLLTPCGLASTSAKYSNDGELFALLQLRKDISEDTSAGRLILNNCTAVNLALAEESGGGGGEEKKRRVYETVIEDKGKNSIYMKLSPQTVRELKLKSDMDVTVDIQFKLNRLTFCEWHRAVDKVADYRLIFPDTLAPPLIPWTPKKQWMDVLDGAKLNAKQKEAVLAITSPQTVPLPPILLIGPFGTGKTFTLALAIKQLLSQPEPRILICTHSNSAADLYIKEYLHPWVTDEKLEAARPLRVYYHKRWVTTAHPIVQQYCLIDVTPMLRSFRRPTVEDLQKHRIVVVTLSISQELAALDLPKGFFTHIFLDEAAQAMECEAIMALGLASETSKIVLAGDHMQMSPELFSEFAKERNMQVSLLERLYDHYPTDFPTKILLCENYRAHEAIIKFTSELFYDQKLIASGKQPRHEKFYPLTFFTTRGEDVQDRNSTTFFNNAEVYEVVERVAELVAKWPTKEWGEMTEGSIGIMTPYADQVMRIRMELRRRKLGKISVERVLNVQGKQFRAVFLSTVRTRKTCPGQDKVAGAIELDYGFLSNSKLLNTAITRSQSLVAVVGDPVALCSIGRCRKVWERFIETCNENKSLFGITWSMLRAQLDGVELKKAYVLNPLAPEFVPRAEMLRRMMVSGGDYGMYYTGGGAEKAPPNCPAAMMMRHGGGGQQIRPFLNVDDMMEMYNPSSLSNAYRPQNPHLQQNPPHGGMATNKNLNRNPFMNNPQGPQGPPPPNQFLGQPLHQPPHLHHPHAPPQPMGNGPFDRPLQPQLGMPNNNPPLPMGGPHGVVAPGGVPPPPPAVKWGTVPPNINPQLTGTNAWQMNKPGVGYPPQPQKMMPQMQPPPLQPPQGINTNTMRSPTHNPMMAMNHPQMGPHPQWPMLPQNGHMNNAPNRQSPMVGGMDFMPNHPNIAPQMNIPSQPPLGSIPVAPALLPQGMAGGGAMRGNNGNVRAPPGMGGGGGGGGAPFPPQMPTNDLNQEMFHRMQMQQQQQQLHQMRMGGPPQQRVEPDQERFMMMNAGLRQNVPNNQLPVKNGLNPNVIGPLLPPNKNIYEMALESKDVQLKWFTRLVESHGWDAAYKFAEMMGQAQSVMAQEFAQRQQQQPQQVPPQPQINKNQQHPMMAGNNGPHQQQQQQQNIQNQQQQMMARGGIGAGGMISPNMRQMDTAFESLLSGQPIRKLFEEPIQGGSASGGGGGDGSRIFDDGLFGASQLLGGMKLEQAPAANPTVPLYRRQAGQSTTSSSSVSSMSSQSANHNNHNGWEQGMNSGGHNVGDGLFSRMPVDYGNMFGAEMGGGGGMAASGQKNENHSERGNAAAITYASVLQQQANRDAPRVENTSNGMWGVSGGMSGGSSSNNNGGRQSDSGENGGEEKKFPSLDLQVGHRNGFYNYFG